MIFRLTLHCLQRTIVQRKIEEMKHLRLLFALSTLLVAGFATTNGLQAQTLRNANYVQLGKISANGTVRNAQFVTVGYFNTDGSISDRNRNKVGRISGDMQVYDASGKRVGYITVDGAVHDGESRVIGHIDRKTGKVSDGDYNAVGYAENLNIVWIACYYFFNFFN